MVYAIFSCTQTWQKIRYGAIYRQNIVEGNQDNKVCKLLRILSGLSPSSSTLGTSVLFSFSKKQIFLIQFAVTQKCTVKHTVLIPL